MTMFLGKHEKNAYSPPDRKVITDKNSIITKIHLGEPINLVRLFIGIWAGLFLTTVCITQQ